MQLTASEEDVWRGVLAWGQAKAGVQSSVRQWTDSDRTKMKQVLNVSNIIFIITYCVNITPLHQIYILNSRHNRMLCHVYKYIYIHISS